MGIYLNLLPPISRSRKPPIPAWLQPSKQPVNPQQRTSSATPWRAFSAASDHGGKAAHGSAALRKCYNISKGKTYEIVRMAPVSNSETDIAARLERYRAAFDLNGKTALVLGAASGIGKASAEALAALGANVICADKDRDGVERTATDIGTHVKSAAHVIDAGVPNEVQALGRQRDEIRRDARHRGHDAGGPYPQAVPRLYGRRIRSHRRFEFARCLHIPAHLRAHHARARRRQLDRHVVHARDDPGTGPGHLRRHQGGHCAVGAWARFRARAARRAGQRGIAGHRRHGSGGSHSRRAPIYLPSSPSIRCSTAGASRAK